VAIDDHFGAAVVDRELRQYRKRGPGPTARLLLSAIKEQQLQGVTLLDIGGGFGVIQCQLLGETVEQAALVEASSAFLERARRETERLGHGARAEFIHGDYVEIDDQLSSADIVTMDRVVCCYPNSSGLLKKAANKSLRLIGLSYPRNRRLVRLGVRLENLFRKLTGNPFRSYVHSPAQMKRLVEEAGFQRCFMQQTFAWEVVAFRRTG
jgi:magnesium-protoporphyrin O-methyltransferase